jgi:hypothetical protein
VIPRNVHATSRLVQQLNALHYLQAYIATNSYYDDDDDDDGGDNNNSVQFIY